MLTDPIADMLTRIRNANKAMHDNAQMPTSRMKEEIARLLKDEGYIKDFRVVDTQGMSTFTALQRRGIPSRFLYLPEENHWVLRPQSSKRWHDEVLGWIDRFAKPAGKRR